MSKRVLSGIRATGRLHLGNYLGAVKGMIALQNDEDYETFYMVADLHAVTTPFDKEGFQEKVRDVVLDYLAAGLDPEKTTLFVQSAIPEHIELAYLLGTNVSIARLSHLPTYKEKVKQYPEEANLALLSYPVLMAADILAYKAEAVPVGDDQLPHLEISREIARKMNDKYDLEFPEPKQYKTKGHYVLSLTGEGKMSKSVEGSYINLTDDLATIKDKMSKVPTDEGKGDTVPKDGGVAALLFLVEYFQGEARREEYEDEYKGEGLRYSGLKDELSEAIFEELKPLQERRKIFEDDPERVDKILEKGSERAREVARETLGEVKKAMGIN